MHILGHDAQSDDDLAGGLGLQPESVGGRGDHLKVLQPRSAAEKEGCAQRSDRRHGRSERCDACPCARDGERARRLVGEWRVRRT